MAEMKDAVTLSVVVNVVVFIHKKSVHVWFDYRFINIVPTGFLSKNITLTIIDKNIIIIKLEVSLVPSIWYKWLN
jgi:hypothetical protein